MHFHKYFISGSSWKFVFMKLSTAYELFKDFLNFLLKQDNCWKPSLFRALFDAIFEVFNFQCRAIQ